MVDVPVNERATNEGEKETRRGGVSARVKAREREEESRPLDRVGFKKK